LKQIRVLLLAGLVFMLADTEQADACTTAVISGRGTPDGRPLLYKHRDSDYYQNKLMTFNDGKYAYIGLVNSEDTEGKEIWEGANSAGFAIMNSQSYNLNIKDTTSLKDQEGIIMKEALRTCATLQDFEDLLTRWPKPMGVEANFGVIDAHGGAAYYETTNFAYKKIDGNDPAVAPFGYLIRTNYSFTGSIDGGYGYIRYMTAEALFYQAAAQNNLTCRFLLQGVSRSLKHSLQNIDLQQTDGLIEDQAFFVAFEDYIPRYSSVASMVIQGVKPGEAADLSTIWTILGFPLCSVAVPSWVSAGPVLPSVLAADTSGNAPLCQLALNLKKTCFPVTRGSGKKYINLSVLINKQNNGIMQKLPVLENELFNLAEEYLHQWRQAGIDSKEVSLLYQQLSEMVLNGYKDLFDLSSHTGRL
jgi:hypothetical protein